MTRQRRRRIAIEWRPDRLRDRLQAHVLGVKHAVPVGEMMHGKPVPEGLSQQSIEDERPVARIARRFAGTARIGRPGRWRTLKRSLAPTGAQSQCGHKQNSQYWCNSRTAWCCSSPRQRAIGAFSGPCFSPMRLLFPTALSIVAPFCGHLKALCRHSFSCFSRNL